MTTQPTLDQIQYLFSFPFKDERWKNKFLIGFLLYLAGFLIPIIPWIVVTGYFSKVVEISLEGDALTLPEWEDWGELFRSGLRISILVSIAMLPVFILVVLGYAAMLVPAFSSAYTEASYTTPGAVEMLLAPMIAMFGGMLLMGMGAILGLLISFILPPALTHMIAEDEFKAGFQIGSWWSVFKGNLGGYLIAYILVMGSTFIISFALQMMYITLILCILLPFAASVMAIYLGIIMGAIFGQTYRVGLEKALAEDVPPA